jgi:hypothetical protein
MSRMVNVIRLVMLRFRDGRRSRCGRVATVRGLGQRPAHPGDGRLHVDFFEAGELEHTMLRENREETGE